MPKKRGAPPGNKNAYKHGFYAHAFSEQERLEVSQSAGRHLQDEIYLFKTMIARIAGELKPAKWDSMSFSENLNALNVVSMAIARLTNLYRMNTVLYGRADAELTEFLRGLGFTEAEIEQELYGPPPQSLSGAKKNTRGSQAGNTNALKHGFYASVFKPHEIRNLESMNERELKDEIALLRILIKRTFASMADSSLHLTERFRAVRAITIAAFCIEKLERTKRLVFDEKTTLEEIIQDGLNEARKDLGILDYLNPNAKEQGSDYLPEPERVKIE